MSTRLGCWSPALLLRIDRLRPVLSDAGNRQFGLWYSARPGELAIRFNRRRFIRPVTPLFPDGCLKPSICSGDLQQFSELPAFELDTFYLFR